VRRPVVVLACIGIFLGSACSSKSSSNTRHLTKTEFVARANAICRAMNAQAKTVPNPGNDPNKLAAASDRVAAITATALRKIRALPQPPNDAATLDAIYSKLDAILVQWGTLAAAARAGNKAAAQRSGAKLSVLVNQANAASNAYGLTVCGASG
jgi:hypothetical protein